MIILSLIYCCLLLRSFTKADTPITRKNVPNVGSAVELGELYDATRDVLMINNLFTRETIEEKSTILKSKSAVYLIVEYHRDDQIHLEGGKRIVSSFVVKPQVYKLNVNTATTSLFFPPLIALCSLYLL